MKILFLAAEFPYPPNHGGRSDTWQRLCGFKELGVEVHLICWYSDRRGGPPTEQELNVVRGVVTSLEVFEIELRPLDLAWRLYQMGRMPSHASARMLRGKKLRVLISKVRQYAIEAIWLDGLWPAGLALKLSQELKLPYFYRSHNIEYKYMARQAALARQISYRIRLWLNVIGLKKFELEVVLGAKNVFDISIDDLEIWRRDGLSRGEWLPPIAKTIPVDFVVLAVKSHDLAFVGNLHTPNNVEGLTWFFRSVWPIIISKRPNTTVHIAGSAPSSDVIELTRSCVGVQLTVNPEDVWSVYTSARVLFNPVRNGSGMNIKSVEMLQTDSAIVSTSVGVAGLPDICKRQFYVCDSADVYAKAILNALNGDLAEVDVALRAASRKPFGKAAIERVIEVIKNQLSTGIA